MVSITDINSLACGHARVQTGSGDGGGSAASQLRAMQMGEGFKKEQRRPQGC